jgi:cytochrome c551
MKKSLLAVLLGATFALAACGGDDTTTEDTTKSDGEKIVMKSCATCHGGNLQGSRSTPNLNEVGGRLTEDEIYDVIVNGTKNGMPAGLISDEDAAKAAEWLSQQK